MQPVAANFSNDGGWFEGIQQFADNWGNLASVSGLVLSLLGFGLTLWGVWRSKSAAEAAQEAALKAKDAIVRSQTIMDFSAALVMMEEIKRLHRVSAWSILPDRYSLLRRMLIAIRGANPDMSDEFKAHMTGATQQLADCESVVEEFLASSGDKPNPARLNAIVSVQVDKLSEILEALKQDIGGRRYGRRQDCDFS